MAAFERDLGMHPEVRKDAGLSAFRDVEFCPLFAVTEDPAVSYKAGCLNHRWDGACVESCVFVIVGGDDDDSRDVFITPNELESIIKIIEDPGAGFPTRPRGEEREE